MKQEKTKTIETSIFSSKNTSCVKVNGTVRGLGNKLANIILLQVKNDEFYVQLRDIYKEVQTYLDFTSYIFCSKTVLCLCYTSYESIFVPLMIKGDAIAIKTTKFFIRRILNQIGTNK
jgi:hypothetical protein